MDFKNLNLRSIASGPSYRPLQSLSRSTYSMSKLTSHTGSSLPASRVNACPPRTFVDPPCKTPIASPLSPRTPTSPRVLPHYTNRAEIPDSSNHELLPLSPPPSSFTELNLHDHLFPPSAAAIHRQISDYLGHENDILPHLEQSPIKIDHVSPQTFNDFLHDYGDEIRLRHLKIEYDSHSSWITVCSPPTPYHDCTPLFLQNVLFSLRGTSFDTDARQATLGVREISFRSRDGSYLVPDAAVVVLDDETTPRLWPTIVVEVANSQSYESAVEKVKRWFVKSKNTVEVALLLKFTAKNPLLDPACFLEVYRARVVDEGDEEWDDDLAFESDSEASDDGLPVHSDDDDEGLQSDGNENDEIDGSVATRGTIGPNDPDAGHHLIDEDSLLRLDDRDSSPCLTVQNQEPDPEIPPVLAPTPDDLSSPSSTSSNPPTPSPSSAASGRASDPAGHTPVHSLHIFVEGPRNIILPVADPPDPEMRYVSLRYSDFFGSENVPPGKNVDEPVRLDLDVLRREVRNLMRLTQRQVGNVKRRGREEKMGVEKRVRR